MAPVSLSLSIARISTNNEIHNNKHAPSDVLRELDAPRDVHGPARPPRSPREVVLDQLVPPSSSSATTVVVVAEFRQVREQAARHGVVAPLDAGDVLEAVQDEERRRYPPSAAHVEERLHAEVVYLRGEYNFLS